MGEPKRHHFNPQMLLRRFSDEDAKLYFFDKRRQEKGVLRTTPKDLFVQRHLYSTIEIDGTRDTSLEQYYARIESIADRIIEKITSAARSGKLPNLSESEKGEWDNYLYRQWSRVPDLQVNIQNKFDGILAESIKEFEKDVRPLTAEERASLEKPETRTRLKHNSRIKALSAPPGEAVELLSTLGLGVAAITRSNKSFVIGSLPVAKLTLPNRTHISDPSVEVWLPIASDVAVSPFGSKGSERLIQLDRDRHIRALNTAIFRQSTVIAGRSKELITSLVQSR